MRYLCMCKSIFSSNGTNKLDILHVVITLLGLFYSEILPIDPGFILGGL